MVGRVQLLVLFFLLFIAEPLNAGGEYSVGQRNEAELVPLFFSYGLIIQAPTLPKEAGPKDDNLQNLLSKTSDEVSYIKWVNFLIVIFSLLTLLLVFFSSAYYKVLTSRFLQIEKFTTSSGSISREQNEKDNEIEIELEGKIQQVNRELTLSNLRLLQTNEFLLKIKSELEYLANEYPETKTSVKRMIKDFASNVRQEKEWESFHNYYEEALGGFFDQLVFICPQITAHEKRLAALIRLDLPNDQIASILGIAPTSVKVLKHRLKKKLNVPDTISIANFLASIEYVRVEEKRPVNS